MREAGCGGLARLGSTKCDGRFANAVDCTRMPEENSALNRAGRWLGNNASWVLLLSASFAMWTFLPAGYVSSYVREFAAIPMIGSLFLGLFQVFRDTVAHERAILLQSRQSAFTVGATSHMAIVAFDKHVGFAEEYVTAMFEILAELFRRGPYAGALDGASKLMGIRSKWALWVTAQVEADLEKLEAALRSIGANANLVAALRGDHDLQNARREMYAKFAQVMGPKVMGSTEWQGETISEEVAVHTIIAKLRQVLGVEQLTQLRAHLISQAAERLELRFSGCVITKPE